MDDQDTGYKPSKQNLELAEFITSRTDVWRDHRRANFEPKWDAYERMWRGIFALDDRQRQSERAQIVTPVISAAIDTRRTEIEEAIFGQNLWFDIDDDDADPTDVAKMKKELMLDFKRDKVKKIVSQINTNAEVYGTGIAEIVMNEVPMLQPATEGTALPGVEAVGTKSGKRKSIKPYPVHPRNFLIDGNAKDVDDALGCAIEEHVAIHTIIEKMEKGLYNKCPINSHAYLTDLDPVTEDSPFTEDKVVVLRYYGKVPAEYLTASEEEENKLEDLEEKSGAEALFGEYDDYADMVEAVVVVCNGHILYAKENPYMMKDRPIIVYRPEIIPGRFWGRGTCEKGESSQRAIDGQMRAHLDFSAITAAPMIATDTTRMPRGFKFDIIPGKNIGVQGPPGEILMPITFGATSPVNMETAAVFERYLAQATATADSAALNNVSNGTDPAVMSMMMSSLVKKHKHSLLNFQEDFLIPLVQKCAWRYMQFDPDRYPVNDFSFIPISTMGMMAREYEQQQLIGLLQTLGPDSKIVPLVLSKIIENSNLSGKEELQKQLMEASQPDPQQQQAQQQEQQMKQQIMQAQLDKVRADAEKAKADALLAMEKAKAIPQEITVKLATALSNNLPDGENGPDPFEQRMKLMQEETKRLGIQQKQQDTASNERIAQLQTRSKNESDRMKVLADLKKAQLTSSKVKGA